MAETKDGRERVIVRRPTKDGRKWFYRTPPCPAKKARRSR